MSTLNQSLMIIIIIFVVSEMINIRLRFYCGEALAHQQAKNAVTTKLNAVERIFKTDKMQK
ncbi:hypothetical protein FHU10_4769 [Serratia fonticola]|uniref:Uncharacterized protein n=1 Tax=Serratia fonticola TaxID=47917 RepID=A0A559TBY3_SERFO|nr:hypothetical protein FHU09_2936 [Serratia fonticola]TQI97606.1 hypothetical protein FHU11_3109 [Serratia fonticola]TVZ72104.1 hypothetical protein FHU10_4769 [Serratia fonticola]